MYIKIQNIMYTISKKVSDLQKIWKNFPIKNNKTSKYHCEVTKMKKLILLLFITSNIILAQNGLGDHALYFDGVDV